MIWRIAIPTHGNLLEWAQRGVLLLNTVLTVRHKTANSHQKEGLGNIHRQSHRRTERPIATTSSLFYGAPKPKIKLI